MGCSISGFSSISESSSYHLKGISWVRKAMPSIRLDAFWKSSSVGRYVLGVGYSIEYYYREVRIKSSIGFIFVDSRLFLLYIKGMNYHEYTKRD